MEVMLHPDGAEILYWELGSCGNDSCDPVLRRLAGLKEAVPLESFTTADGWQKPVFGNLKAYAVDEKVSELNAAQVARYFGGSHHIEAMIRKAPRSNIGILLGLDAGLVLDVLLPLAEGEYRNGDLALSVGNFVVVNPESQGIPCYHRGVVINIELGPEDLDYIYRSQRDSEPFVRAIKALNGKTDLPPEFIEALKMTH